MSNIIYIVSDCPLEEIPNPHEKMMSVNEALAAGATNIPDFLLNNDFDKDKPGVIMVGDRSINLNLDTGVIEDGDFDDDYSVWIPDDIIGLLSNKKYFAVFQWNRLTEGRARNIISYIADALKITEEIELWHIWLGAEDQYHKIVTKKFSIGELKPEDIFRLDNRKMWGDIIADDVEIVYDYCYVISAKKQ